MSTEGGGYRGHGGDAPHFQETNPMRTAARGDQRMTITLPWPPAILSPNQRPHWSAKSRAAASYRAECFWSTKAAQTGLLPLKQAPLDLRVIFCAPNTRKRDRDNLLASIKAGLDGMAQALGIDDSLFARVTIEMGPVIKCGEVRITLQEIA